MPSRKDIEEFSRAIDGLGVEPEAPEKKDAAPKKEPAQDDLGLSEPMGPLDFGAATEESQAESTGDAGLDFTSLFGEEAASTLGGSTDTLPEPEPGMGEPSGTGEGELGPEPDLSALSEDLEQMGLIPGEGLSEPGKGEQEAPLPPELGDLSGLGFEEPSAGPAAPGEIAEPSAEEFDASALFASAASPEAEIPEQPEAGMPFPPEGETEQPAAEASGIELPSFDEMNVAQEEEALGKDAKAAPAAEASAPSTGEELFLPEGLEMGEEAVGPTPGESEEIPGAEQAHDELALDEFTLPESVKEFGIPQRPSGYAQKAKDEEYRTPEAPSEGIEELAAPEIDITLSDEQFARLRKCLNSLPRNLKIAVEDIVAAGRGSGQDQKKLIQLLVQGAAPRDIAALAGSITGTRIRLPAGVEKKTGVAFEEEQRSFGYAFRQNILPIVRVFSLTAIAFALFIFLGYKYVYQPISAFMEYRTGYDHLQGNRFTLSNEDFDKATSIWPMKSWYYRYAEGYAEKLKYEDAGTKYEQLLQRWPLDKKGILDYAAMKSLRQQDYPEANRILQQLLDKNMWDYEGLMAAGDNALEWGAKEPSHLEEARLDYASLIERYGEKDALLFRMLRYFVRTDNKAEAERLREYFSARKDTKVDAQAYAEYGGYLVDKNEMTYVQDVLFAALAVKPDMALIHYNLARYYQLLNDPAEERKALTRTLELLKPTDIINPARITMEVDTHRRMGNLDYATQAFIEAERQYKEAVAAVEAAQKNNSIKTGAIFGQAYNDLADFNYYKSGDLNNALALYGKAAENGYVTREMDYKIGYIRYSKGDYKDALDRFLAAYEAGSPARTPANLLYTIGNTFYQRDDVFAAQGYFLTLAGILKDRMAGIANLQPQDNPDHESLVLMLKAVNNNLGVATLRISQKMGDRKKRSEALTYLSAATEEADALTRNTETLQRSSTTDLPYLNMRGILYPQSDFIPQIYVTIPKDLEALWKLPQ